MTNGLNCLYNPWRAPKLYTRENVHAPLTQMGYAVIASDDGVVHYCDIQYPSNPVHLLVLDFNYGPMPEQDFLNQLQMDGANVDLFHAFFEE